MNSKIGMLLFACVFPVNRVLAEEALKPNIIFILADDLGYGDVKSYNPDCKILTPNIDQLATQGMVFTDAHSGSSVSSPTRYGVLTGRYSWRTSLKKGAMWWYDKPLISEDRTTMASMLKQQGYFTACIGKWHLGMNFPTKDGGKPVDTTEFYNLDFSQTITGGPCDVGFDYYFGVDAPNFPPYCFIENRHTIGIPDTFYPVDYKRDMREGRGLANWEVKDILPTIQEKACGFIEEQVIKQQPFFLYLPLTSPHTPIVPSGEFKGFGLNEYTDFVTQTDAVVGAVISILKKHKINNNTLVVFTSDNGCSYVADFGFLKEKGHNPSFKFRGSKSDLYDGGHRIPCIVCWPDHIRPSIQEQTICLNDFMATFAAISRYELDSDEAEDSFDLSPILLDPDCEKVIREATVHHSGDGAFAIRQGKWKLLTISYSGGWSEPRKPLEDGPKYQLYDMENDPGEQHNLYEKYPKIVNELESLLKKYIKEGRSTPGDKQTNDGPSNWPQLSWMN